MLHIVIIPKVSLETWVLTRKTKPTVLSLFSLTVCPIFEWHTILMVIMTIQTLDILPASARTAVFASNATHANPANRRRGARQPSAMNTRTIATGRAPARIIFFFDSFLGHSFCQRRDIVCMVGFFTKCRDTYLSSSSPTRETHRLLYATQRTGA